MAERQDRLDAVLGAALGAPGPDPGHADLAAARRRFLDTLHRRRRRRASLAGGAVLAVAVTLGALAAVGDLSGPPSTTTASPPTGAPAVAPARPACRLDGGATRFSCGSLTGGRVPSASEAPASHATTPDQRSGSSAPLGGSTGAVAGPNDATSSSTVPLRVGQVLTVTLPGRIRLDGPVAITGGVAVTSAGRRELRITGGQAGLAEVRAPVRGPSCPTSPSCRGTEVAETLTIDLEVST